MGLVFLYVMSYCCSTQIFAIRFFTGLFISIVLTLLQGLGTYLVYASQWCNETDTFCTIGRSTIFSIVASCCYFLSGLLFIVTSDYPGKQQLQEIRNEEEAATDKENTATGRMVAPAAPAAAVGAVGVTSAAVIARGTDDDDEVI